MSGRISRNYESRVVKTSQDNDGRMCINLSAVRMLTKDISCKEQSKWVDQFGLGTSATFPLPGQVPRTNEEKSSGCGMVVMYVIKKMNLTALRLIVSCHLLSSLLGIFKIQLMH